MEGSDLNIGGPHLALVQYRWRIRCRVAYVAMQYFRRIAQTVFNGRPNTDVRMTADIDRPIAIRMLQK
jgi:hypothetical protein